LLNLEGFQFPDQPRPDDETDEESRQNRVDRPEGDVAKDIEE